MKLEVGKHAGFCFGVKRAIQVAFDSGEKYSGVVRTLGPIIHNPQVVQELEAAGIAVAQNLEEIPTDTGMVIIRSHGVGPQIYESANARNLALVDATCPFVKKIHSIVAQMDDEGYDIVVLGEADHPEVIGICAYVTNGRVFVIDEPEKIRDIRLGRKVALLAQTTQETRQFSALLAILGEKNNCEIRSFNTICDATGVRQQEAIRLAQQSDIVIIVGGKKSANTTRLAAICQEIQPSTYHVETVHELDAAWFTGKTRAGITAGASTPESEINKVVAWVQAIGQ
ncbi:4-hydroxy-3-methylbut-2-enyl diphosphate reductase [Chrysiogenes arsenatis]|uniref:4-hydroxy-3-methylbut-2-enyl diphosphate reductase n=1 Tax=Chrysiogenes arsenatis TaxID=309797 RepID=UPI000429AED8|nr:4-hydroxy-3-methylbut-2-enyl diphosphate reductase [Chrysiogenes arsenatis]